jgi:hypothetical protein
MRNHGGAESSLTFEPEEESRPRSHGGARLAETFGTLQGIVTGVIGGAVLWIALAWFVFALLRNVRL